MIPGSEVNLGEYPCSIQLVKQIINARERVLIFDGDLIQLVIVYAHS